MHEANKGVGLTEPTHGSEKFDSLYRSLYSGLVRSVYLIVLDGEVAQEITHEAFLRLWQRRDRLAPGSNERAWLMRVATNLAISHRRSLLTRWRMRQEPVTCADPGAVALAQMELAEMRRALLTLKPRERAVLALRFGEDLSFAQIGSVVGRPEGTVKTWLHRALAKLRVRLESPSPVAPSAIAKGRADG